MLHVYEKQSHFSVHQELTQCCKSTTLQLKKLNRASKPQRNQRFKCENEIINILEGNMEEFLYNFKVQGLSFALFSCHFLHLNFSSCAENVEDLLP